MSKLVQVIQFCTTYLPSWVAYLIVACFGLVVVFVLFKVIKLILDAIPFV